MGYKLSNTARQAIEDMYVYGAINWGEDQASAFQLGLESELGLLVKFPYIGKQVDEYMPGLRQYLYKKYYIFYKVDISVPIILDIRHVNSDVRAHFMDS